MADPFDLNRFIEAQSKCYVQVLTEIKRGRKRSHWMWYIFPQVQGLGHSAMSERYSIKSVGEAEAYLNHSVLGARLTECFAAALGVQGRSAFEVFRALLK